MIEGTITCPACAMTGRFHEGDMRRHSRYRDATYVVCRANGCHQDILISLIPTGGYVKVVQWGARTGKVDGTLEFAPPKEARLWARG